MPWPFRPEKVTQAIPLGDRTMALYSRPTFRTSPITGLASFNVAPEQAGQYFNKIQCFCFTEQTLQPGQEVRMPVLYYRRSDDHGRSRGERHRADHSELHLPRFATPLQRLWTAPERAVKGRDDVFQARPTRLIE